MREFASGGVHLPEIVVKDLASIIGLVRNVIQQGVAEGEFGVVNPLVLHLMVIGGIGYFKTSGPLRLKYSDLIHDPSGGSETADAIDLGGELEKIVLNALTGG